MTQRDFEANFEKLVGVRPFDWQTALWRKFTESESDAWPVAVDIPTGLGKTCVIAVWFLAWIARPQTIPRRLVYVVNRRTVVDQTTNEAIRICDNAHRIGAAIPAISTLRGQFADNGEWSADPARPAVICGTVDMIGSRLLFSGYRIGFKSRSLHAGFLGQDALLVHDEAHLEPAFQALVESIEREQAQGENSGDLPWPKLRVMALSATTRNSQENGKADTSFGLTPDELNPPDNIPDPPTESIHHVWRRLKAKKFLTLYPAGDGKDGVAKEIAKRAAAYKDSNAAVLVFVRTLDDINAVERELVKTKRNVVLLTGTMRGKERDELIEKSEFKRFLKGARPGETVYLVCTSAGEVGLDISADHMVCDLSTFESMAQRFGRVNRYGDCTDSRIDVVYPDEFDEKDKLKDAREATLKLLDELKGDASPLNLSRLNSKERSAAFTPEPAIPPATDILFDAWALTSIREPMPGRPPVEPYLHGIAEWEPPETHVAWREEVEVIKDDLLDDHSPRDLLDDYPLLPHELLRDRSDRVFKQLETLAERHAEKPAWLIDERGTVQATTLKDMAKQKDQIKGKTILLPPSAGGLTDDGYLDGNSKDADDVADKVVDEQGRTRRQRIWDEEPIPSHLQIIRTIDTQPGDDEVTTEDGKASRRFWHWCDPPREGGRTANKPIHWDTHVNDVVDRAKGFVERLKLPQEIADAIIVAAKFHDHGKRREGFQRMLGNSDYPSVLLAKSNRRAAARLPELFRHEFASLFDAQTDAEFIALGPDMQDLALHLIAAHHGRARPHFNADEAFDPERPLGDAEAIAIETPRRFARLQRKYGRWGLAYLESLLRAADWAASAEPSASAIDGKTTL